MYQRLLAPLLALGLLATAPASLSAQEDEVSITPSLEYFLALNSVSTESGDSSTSELSQSQYGLFGLEVGQSAGRYETSGSIALEVTDEDIALYELAGALTRKDITYKMGFYDPSDVSLGMEYLPFKGDDNYFGVYQAQDRYLGVELAEIGLSFNLGAKTASHKADEGDDEANAAVNRTVLASFYGGEFDWGALSFALVGIQNQIDEDKGPSAAAIAEGNYAEQVVTLGIQLGSEDLVLALQGEQISVTTENYDDPEVEARVNLAVDLALGDRAGLGLSAMSKTQNDGSDNPTATTRGEFGYAHLFGPTKLAWMAFSQASKDDDTGLDEKESGLVLGMYVNF